MTKFQFATPRTNPDINQCLFYHVVDIPGVGQVGGHWDLRATIDDYLGNFDYAGKRVLDVGTASGYLTFAMEQRGAKVVSFDAANGRHCDIVPYHNDSESLEQIYFHQEYGLEMLKNSYWFCHEKLGSHAQAYYGDINHLPQELGHFDVAMIGAFFSHLRDPLSALNSIARIGVDRLIITQQTNDSPRPTMELIPRPTGSIFPWSRFTWWNMSDGLFRTYLGVLGYRLERLTRTMHLCVALKPHSWQEYTTYIFKHDPTGLMEEFVGEKQRKTSPAMSPRRLLHSLKALIKNYGSSDFRVGKK